MSAPTALVGPPLAHAVGGPLDLPAGLVLLAGLGYALALGRIRRIGRTTPRPMRPFERGRAVEFGLGLVAVLVALTGPVEHYADELFWVHMVQHLLLLAIAAPLFALAAPWRVVPGLLPGSSSRALLSWWRGEPTGRRIRAALGVLAAPVAAWILFDANLVTWHVPAAFDLTLRNEMAHDLEHLLFLGLGVLFWRHALEAPSVRARLLPVQRAMYVTAASIVGWGVAIALAIAPSPLYAPYTAASATHGLSALADQRIAAGIMLVPGSIPFVIAALAAVARWLEEDGRESPKPLDRSVDVMTRSIGGRR